LTPKENLSATTTKKEMPVLSKPESPSGEDISRKKGSRQSSSRATKKRRDYLLRRGEGEEPAGALRPVRLKTCATKKAVAQEASKEKHGARLSKRKKKGRRSPCRKEKSMRKFTSSEAKEPCVVLQEGGRHSSLPR